MNYEFWFWIGVAFFTGRSSRMRIYIGYNEKKYESADCGILLRK